MSNVAHIRVLANPVTRAVYHCDIPATGRLSDHLKVPNGVVVERNGAPYGDQPLRGGDIITMAVVPQGDSPEGKNTARAAASLAIIVAAPALAGLVGLTTATGLTLGGKLFVGAATIAGNWGAGKLIKYENDDQQVGQENVRRLGDITGTQNRINKYGAVPKIYGRHRLYPSVSAQSYTEILGNNQYLRLLYAVNDGPVRLYNPKIGDQSIGSFDADNVFTANDTFSDVQIDVGENPDNYSTSRQGSIDSTVTQTNPGYTFEDDNTDPGVFTTEQGAREISIDLTARGGLFGITSKGRTDKITVVFDIEFRESGTSTWLPVNLANTISTVKLKPSPGPDIIWHLTGTERETLRGGLLWKVPDPDKQWEVRVTRFNTIYGADLDIDFDDQGDIIAEDSDITNEAVTWTALRSINYQKPTNIPGVVQIGMRVKATDQINGILDTFSVEAQSILAYYDGTQWLEPTFDPDTGGASGGLLTSNPGWALADLLSGDTNSRAVDKARLNGEAFKSWADNCATEGRECNLVIDSQRTVLQLAGVVGTAGRGSLALHDGLYTVVQDTKQDTPIQHFTPRNSWNFSATRTFPKVPHALRVLFNNKDTDYQEDEVVVYDDGYSLDGTNCHIEGTGGTCQAATLFETVRLDGVTDADQAWKEGRYRIAEARLRPEAYSQMVDVEHIVCQRGDMVLSSHDVTLWGLDRGRIKSIESNTLTLDEQVVMEDNKTYNLRVRNSAGDSVVKTVSTNPDSYDVPIAGPHTKLVVDDTVNIAAGDLFMFGETGTETQELKVLSIEPRGDLTARLTLVDAAPAIHDADQGAIPDFDSNITAPVPVPVHRPPVPTLTDVHSAADFLYPQANRDPNLRIVVSFEVGDEFPTDEVELRYGVVGGGRWQYISGIDPASGASIIHGAERDRQYMIQVRSVFAGVKSLWGSRKRHTAGTDVEIVPDKSKAIGTLHVTPGGLAVPELSVNLDVPVYGGDELVIVSIKDGAELYVTVDADDDQQFGPGILHPTAGADRLPIQPQKIDTGAFPRGSVIERGPAQNQAWFKAPPGLILDAIELERTSNSIGDLSADLSGTIISVPLKNVLSTISVANGQEVVITNKRGQTDILTVNGDQTLTPSTDSLTVSSVALVNTYAEGFAWVSEPIYGATSRITKTNNQVNINVSDISANSTSIAGLELQVGDFDTADFQGFEDDIGVIGARTTLFTDVNGNIAKITLLSGTKSSAIDINADQVRVVGQTTFLSALSGEGYTKAGDTQSFAGDGATFQDTPTNFPTTRSDGESRKAGDIAFDTSHSEKPYKYTGTGWIRAYSVIDGGDLIAGSVTANQIAADTITASEIAADTITAAQIAADTITANEIDVANLFAQNITVTGEIKAGTTGDNVKIDSTGLTGTGTIGGVTKETFKIPTDGSAPTLQEFEVSRTIVNITETTELRTSETALDGTVDSAGILIDKDGIFAAQASQNKTKANVRILPSGDAFFAGELEAATGSFTGELSGTDLLLSGNLDVTGKITNTNEDYRIDSDGFRTEPATTELGSASSRYSLGGVGAIWAQTSTNKLEIRTFIDSDLGINIQSDRELNLVAQGTTDDVTISSNGNDVIIFNSRLAINVGSVSSPTSLRGNNADLADTGFSLIYTDAYHALEEGMIRVFASGVQMMDVRKDKVAIGTTTAGGDEVLRVGGEISIGEHSTNRVRINTTVDNGIVDFTGGGVAGLIRTSADIPIELQTNGTNTRLKVDTALITASVALKGSGGFQSSDGSAGITATRQWEDDVASETHNVSIKNGLITAWTVT